MPCPQMVLTPGGEDSTTPAVWNGRVALAVRDTVGFADFAQLTVKVKSGASQPRPVEIEAASPLLLSLILPGPPEGADLQGPHSLIVEGPVTGTCTVNVNVSGVELPAEPTPADLKAVLDYHVRHLELMLAGHSGATQSGLPFLAPGNGAHAGLVNFPPFVTPAGTAVPSAREVHKFFGSRWGGAGGVLGDVLGGVGSEVEGGIGDPKAPASPPGTVPIAPAVEFKLFREDGSQLVQGEDYLGDPVGRGATALVIVPPISKSEGAPAQKITVKVSGKLTAFGSVIGATDVSVPIPELAADLLLEPLALPVPLFAGFRHAKFAPVDGEKHIGAVYVQVPSGWADDELGTVLDAVDAAREVLRPLDRIAFIAELLTGLRILGRVLAAQGSDAVVTKNVVENLKNYRWFKHDHWYGWDSWFEDLYVEDRISSFIALGLRGQGVHCYSVRDNDPGKEWLEVRFTDPIGIAVVDDLRTKSPENTRGRGADVTAKVLPEDEDDLYSDSFSSITLVEA